ncbi:MAG: manganese ABC transporter ATP-binding protein [Chloroflexi bacterium RBG_19FT_COMBO_56_12]|nr:MAG: manganese ABC transporter ATP-binding protein [Chloroflexi bacterium RBG_19FT_COMBO_56_12]
MPQHAVHQPGSPLLELCAVSLRYNGRVALEAVSFQVNNGQRVAVVGPNGAGKSTLFKVIAGLLPATSGEVKVSGAGPGGHICIAYVPQRSQVDWEFPVVVNDVVMMGRIGKLGLLRWPRARDWDYVHHALEVVGLSHLANRQIGELSGGEQQRMFIARALAQEAELMLMDEPLTGLDLPSQEGIFEILDGLGQQGVTVLIAMHDLKLATDRFEQVMLLNRRLIGYGKPTDIFTPERLVAAYGGHLHLVGAGDELLALSDTCCDEATG